MYQSCARARRMSDKTLEQQINMKFSVKIGKSANEMLALLTLAYGKYFIKKLHVFEWHGQAKTQKRVPNVDRI
jgi:hypothetical protein